MSILFEWIREPVGADSAQLDKVEDRFGVVLPADYREFAARNASGMPANGTDFEFHTSTGGDFYGCIGTFLSLEVEGDYSIHVKSSLLGDRLPPRLVPVIEDPAGSFICLDYSKPGAPCVSFWRHDRRGFENEIAFVAGSFSEFLSLLHDPDPTEFED